MTKLRYEMYLLTFSSGRQYIGISKNGAKFRYAKHRNGANNGDNVICHKAWRKYGDPDMQVLAVADEEYIFELEQRAIKSYRTLFPHGYNMTGGGELSPSSARIVAQKISAANKGKPVSQATIDAVRKANTGRKHSAETRAKLSAAQKGRICSEETRRKISEAQKGKPRPPEGLLKMAEALRGRKQTQETIEKRRLARLNTRNPPESYIKGWETRRLNATKNGEQKCL